MTRQISDALINKFLNNFLTHAELRIQAVRKLDVPAANRHLLKASAAAKALAATPEGRVEVERLLLHPALYIRVSAAGVALAWEPEKAVPVLGRLLDADLTAIRSVDERLDVRLRAKNWLYAYFDIRSSDRNDLVEPLRAYGVELSYRDHTKWR